MLMSFYQLVVVASWTVQKAIAAEPSMMVIHGILFLTKLKHRQHFLLWILLPLPQLVVNMTVVASFLKLETNDKIGYVDPLLYPVVSFLDPTYTFTVSKKQTAAGCADAMNHIMEQYFCEDSTLLNDAFMEGALKSLMINAQKCLDNPEELQGKS